jgi:hypothetical protein
MNVLSMASEGMGWVKYLHLFAFQHRTFKLSFQDFGHTLEEWKENGGIIGPIGDNLNHIFDQFVELGLGLHSNSI